MSIEEKVAQHYGRDGLVEAILEQARAKAADPDNLTIEDLAHLDDMHVGGRKASEHLMDKMGLETDMRVLDVGSGIGGPARFAAQTYKLRVTGIDLTPSYEIVANMLSEAVKLDDATQFITGSALEMPFEDCSFDAVYTIHVGMNIRDKAYKYAEIFRVLKPGGVFAIYDIIGHQDNDGLKFPLPWANTIETSFVIPLRGVEQLLETAGFKIESVESRRDFASGTFEKMKKMAAVGNDLSIQPPIRREDFAAKVENLAYNVEQGFLWPWEIICRKS